jgi:hypothetical protein
MNKEHLDRERQREIAVLKMGADSAVEHGTSTYPGTVHASADTMEWLAIEGTELLWDYSAEERRRMAYVGHAMVDGSFPMATCTDVEMCLAARGRTKSPAQLRELDELIERRSTALRCS